MEDRAAEEPVQVAAALNDSVPTAVVIVHGMGQQRPLDTLNAFVQTALRPVGAKQWDYYYSRPAEITGSYEARRYIAPALGRRDDPWQGQTEIFEYHWSYLMTGNRFGDVIPATLRLLLLRPKFVPTGLLGIWRLAWLAIAVVAIAAAFLLALLARSHLPGWVSAVAGSAATAVIVGVIWRTACSFIVNSFVDVVRYLDTSPRSYAARRAIRGGLVDLLHALHDDGRFSRIVLVAHSLGGFIAYDALMSMWAETHEIHAAPDPEHAGGQIPLDGLVDLQDAAAKLMARAAGPPPAANTVAAGRVVEPPDGERGAPSTEREPPAEEQPKRSPLDIYHDRQFLLWQGLRRQGNPWRVTDFVTVGTPMTFADLLVTRRGLLSGLRRTDPTKELFAAMFRRAELMSCPPRSETLHVEDADPRTTKVRYASSRAGVRQVLGSQSVFAVVRWTNLWFPVIRGGLQGDWFGGPLAPLFGAGIRDIAVEGNVPGRQAWGVAHSRYFRYPSADEPNDIAWYLRRALDLRLHKQLVDLLTAPKPDPTTIGRRVR